MKDEKPITKTPPVPQKDRGDWGEQRRDPGQVVERTKRIDPYTIRDTLPPPPPPEKEKN